MRKNKKILDKIKRINFYVILGSLILIASVSIIIDYHFYKSNLDFLNTKRISDTKQNLQDINNGIKSFSQNAYKDVDKIIMAEIKSKAEQGEIIVEAILRKYKNRSIKEKLEHIENAMRVTKFFNNRGYYFIIDKNGKMIFNSVFSDLENTPLNVDDYYKSAIKVMKEGDEGSFQGLMRKPGYPDDELFLKWSYLSRLEGTDWYIGAGEYYYDFIVEHKTELLNNLNSLRDNNNNFFSIIDISAGTFILTNNKILEDPQSIYVTVSKDDDAIFEEAIKATQKQGEGFLDFYLSKSKESGLEAAFVHAIKIPGLNWLILSGAYEETINRYDDGDRAIFRAKIRTNLFVILTLIIIIVFVFNYFNRKMILTLKNLFSTLELFFKDTMQTNQLMNKDELKYNEFMAIADSVNKMLVAKKEIADALIKDKLYVDQLMTENPEAIALVDNNSCILKINPAFTDLFGYTINECKGLSIDELLCTAKELANARNNTIKVATGTTVQFYANRMSKDGKDMNMHITGIPVVVQRKVEAVFAVYQDKTDIIEHEIALKIASDQALEASKTKSQFLANMSHEIRTPMNGVIGMTDLLDKTQLTGEQADYVDTIKMSGESLLRVINDILDFSKIESGKHTFNYTDFDLSSCIEKSLNVIALKVQEKGIKLSYSIDPDVPIYVNSDFDRLKQVLINLLNNAYKFTNEGFIKIMVSKVKLENNRYTLKFMVCDTGIGIPKDKLLSIFDSFSQVDSSLSRNYTGTGLGLAISKAIIQNLNGSIWVESKLNIGTKIYFTMQTESRVIISDDKTIHDRFSKAKIGVIANQDEYANIKTVLSLLVDSLDQVADSETLQILGNFHNNWDILIIDYHLFKSFRDTILSFIKKINLPSLSIIFLKNMKDEKNTNENGDASVYFLNYPIAKNKLIDKVSEALGFTKHEDNEEEVLPLEIITKLKILVAEDNTINQKLMERLFRKIGITADLANDGQEALEMALAKNYDIIFMDIQMPRLDGLKATEMIRENLKDKAPAIIALTANVLPEDKEKCVDSGMVAFLPKPVKIKDIEKILYKFVKKEI